MVGSGAARIYYLHPLLAGTLPWDAHLDRCVELGFTHLLIAPPFASGRTQNVFLTADHERPHGELQFSGDALSLLRGLSAACKARGLSLLLDLAIDRVAADGVLARSESAWFRDDSLLAIDPRRSALERGAATFRYVNESMAAYAAVIDASAMAWWSARLQAWIDAGVDGFRCLGLQQTPAALWQTLIKNARRHKAEVRFLAWTPGLLPAQVAALATCGFDATASSAAWWDYRAGWFADELQRLTRIAPPLSFPESPFDLRIASHVADTALRQRAARRALWFCASIGSDWMMTMGFEFGARAALDPARSSAEDFKRLLAQPLYDLSADIVAANAFIAADALRAQAATSLRQLSAADAPVAAFLRAAQADPRAAQSAQLILVNADLDAARTLAPDDVLPYAGGRLGQLQTKASSAVDEIADKAAPLHLGAGETRVLQAEVTAAVLAPSATRSKRAVEAALRAPRIAIENLNPSVDGGRFALRRIAGETIQVEADIFSDGHELIAAALLWRPLDQRDWNEVPLQELGNDRWRAAFTPLRIGRHEFTVLAWDDPFASLQSGLAKKQLAGIDITLELEEGRLLLAQIAAASDGELAAGVAAIAASLNKAKAPQRLETLLAPATAAAVAAARYRPFSVQREPAIALEVERTAARYASWYELFPRSQTDDAKRHGTFADVIERLPLIREMGFDVLYFPPIHPIGKTHRKGPNNALKAGKGDPGSPYAIGGAEGGHDAIHSELGTLEDFRALIAAASEQGLEIALDFAIQCSPDHPWLQQHPGWFTWRPDGSMKYAENPPKKYQDIVNVDFYADDAKPDLWFSLRDIVLGWVGAGVKIFRVDNPHTKPLPFWEWLIADVRGRHPEVIFLAEAFTRPAMMYRLAKIGFSQSYTYFTWRNSKQELAQYLTELNTKPVSEFYRPHFFVNTPDINPVFLQSSGRAGFLIRAALATMGSGLWGMYAGFERCEATPLPDKEEYLDSEKFQIRPQPLEHFRPGPHNIIGEIAQLNRIRRENPALQTHLGLRLYNAWNDRILYFGKATADKRNFILVAVSFDPHQAQEAHFELPLWELGLPDDASIEGEDLMNGHRWWWHGKTQFMRIEPWACPFGIWRLRTPVQG
ncbi:MAG: glgE [Nevskia sp.]|nr:glgE [Nevskia sp.]